MGSTGRRHLQAGRGGAGVAGAVAFLVCAGACGSTATVHPASPPPGSAPRTVAPPGPPTVTAAVGGRYVRTVVVSGLRVSPMAAGATPLGLDWKQARAVVEATTPFADAHEDAVLGYGTVSLTGVRLPRGTPSLAGRPGWVAFIWGFTTSCPSSGAGTPVRGTSASSTSTTAAAPYVTPYTAVVLDAAGGRGGVVYAGRGSGPCGGAMQAPTVTTADENVSEPWTRDGTIAAGTVPLRYRAPECATMASGSSSGEVRTDRFSVAVDVQLPLDLAGCGPTTTHATTAPVGGLTSTPGAPSPEHGLILLHARTGPVDHGGPVAGDGPTGS